MYMPRKYESVSFREFLRNIEKKASTAKSMRLLRIDKTFESKAYKHKEITAFISMALTRS